METELSVASKVRLEDYIVTDGLNQEMLDTMLDYLLTLRVSESTKELYLQRLRMFGLWLIKNGIRSFTNVRKADVNRFLSNYDKNNTKNGYITALRPFYKAFLNKPDVVKDLGYYAEELEPITPSEVLTPDEVVTIAEKAGERREMYKVIILSLFESCARVNELLHLKKGDVQFHSVTDKEAHRKLIATLYFKRSKGNVPKQPVTLIMFASELKRYCDNHHGDSQSWLFPSPYDSNNPITKDTVQYVLWHAGERLGVKKRLYPHWLRHSGLSFFANSKNYNEQLLMWRAGWTNTAMARRYIHSGAELEEQAYLQRMGYQVEEKEENRILPKTCPHCQAINPYTNTNCDFCAMPLDLEEYQKEIEKKRKITELYQNLEGLSKGKLTEEQEAMIKARTETIVKLTEMGRDDLAEQYIETLLESWVKTFLTV
ncbi:tyrosine-type recombinase/integrase [Candidatus Bathyarchaeota archaeon]|nr:tyrosine-type recombinase/integrase [Candidatus Bathyarchaeota archaeon]